MAKITPAVELANISQGEEGSTNEAFVRAVADKNVVLATGNQEVDKTLGTTPMKPSKFSVHARRLDRS